MHKIVIGVIFTLLLFSVPYVSAKTLYTWTDKDGVVHITETKPPADAQMTDKVTSHAKPGGENPEVDQQKKVQRKAMLMEGDAEKKAKRARREANLARKTMEEAVEKANAMKAETDEYIREWGIRARHRKSIKAKIDRKKDATDEAVAEAQKQIKIATEAEAKARDAEKELADLQQLSRESSAYSRNLEAEAQETATPPE